MSPARFRPEIRIPWPALAAFAAAVYIVHSAMRGWDFIPDLTDLIVFGLFAVVLLLRPLLSRIDGGPDGDGPEA